MCNVDLNIRVEYRMRELLDRSEMFTYADILRPIFEDDPCVSHSEVNSIVRQIWWEMTDRGETDGYDTTVISVTQSSGKAAKTILYYPFPLNPDQYANQSPETCFVYNEQ